MWNDTYLQQLQESEPFGGIKLREAKDVATLLQQLKDPTASQAGWALFYVQKTTNAINQVYLNIGNGKTDIYVTGKQNNEPVSFFDLKLTPKDEDKVDENNVSHYLIKSLDLPSARNLFSKYKLMSTSNGKGYNDSQWKSAQAEVQQKYGKSWGSDVAASVGNALGAKANIGWAGN